MICDEDRGNVLQDVAGTVCLFWITVEELSVNYHHIGI